LICPTETMDETNPYASPVPYEPATREESFAPKQQQPGRPAWREGDVLVVPGKNAVLPRACVLTNRTGSVWRWRIVESPLWGELMLALLLLVPFAGLVVGAIGAHLLIGTGWAAEIRLWLRRPIAAAREISQTVAVLLMLASNVLTGLALVREEMRLLLLGLVCYATAAALVYLPARVFTGVRTVLAADGVVRVRGVHPEYLDRLPEKADSQEWVWPDEQSQD